MSESRILTIIQHFHNYGDMEKSKAVTVLAALAQETRLDIVRCLLRQGLSGAPAGAIGRQLDLPSATLSFHLNALRHAGLVTSQRKGRSITYTADFATMNATMAYLMDNCCRGDVVAATTAEPRATRRSAA